MWLHSLSVPMLLLLSYLVVNTEVRYLALEIPFGSRRSLVSFLGFGAVLIVLLLVLRLAVFPTGGLYCIYLFLLFCVIENSETDVGGILVGKIYSSSIKIGIFCLFVCVPAYRFCRLWAQKLTGLVLPRSVWLVLLVQRSQ